MTNPQRIGMAHTRMVNNEKTLELLLRYETSFSRMHDRAMKALFRLREESNLRNDPNPDPPPQPNASNPSRDPAEWSSQPAQILTPESDRVKENAPPTPDGAAVVPVELPEAVN
ncbi:MAG: hypothetical protein ABJF23_30935 [Bryobacteraceae bacterium]